MIRYKDLKLKNLKKERKKIKLIKHIIQQKQKNIKISNSCMIKIDFFKIIIAMEIINITI
jgi:hypothetical protein